MNFLISIKFFVLKIYNKINIDRKKKKKKKIKGKKKKKRKEI